MKLGWLGFFIAGRLIGTVTAGSSKIRSLRSTAHNHTLIHHGGLGSRWRRSPAGMMRVVRWKPGMEMHVLRRPGMSMTITVINRKPASARC